MFCNWASARIPPWPCRSRHAYFQAWCCNASAGDCRAEGGQRWGRQGRLPSRHAVSFLTAVLPTVPLKKLFKFLKIHSVWTCR